MKITHGDIGKYFKYRVYESKDNYLSKGSVHLLSDGLIEEASVCHKLLNTRAYPSFKGLEKIIQKVLNTAKKISLIALSPFLALAGFIEAFTRLCISKVVAHFGSYDENLVTDSQTFKHSSLESFKRAKKVVQDMFEATKTSYYTVSKPDWATE